MDSDAAAHGGPVLRGPVAGAPDPLMLYQLGEYHHKQGDDFPLPLAHWICRSGLARTPPMARKRAHPHTGVFCGLSPVAV